LLQQVCNITARGSLPAPSARRILLIHNPTAGGWRARRFAAVVQALRTRGCTVAVRGTARRGDAEAFAGAASAADFDLVAVAGGDGTINEAANGLASGASSLPLGIVPLGTANVLAHEIGMPFSADGIARVLAEGRPRPIHPGVLNGRLFLQMAGAGFDAHVVATVDPDLKRRLGKLAYVLATLRAIGRFSFPRHRVRLEGGETEAASVIVAKGHFYGGTFVCCPDARLEDPLFQVCLFERSGPWATVRYALALGTGRLARLKDVRLVKTRALTVEGPEGAPLQADGDGMGRLPAVLEIREEPLSLLYP
jgi:YegS/Rv2252/BmrU family lipid kinase